LTIFLFLFFVLQAFVRTSSLTFLVAWVNFFTGHFVRQQLESLVATTSSFLAILIAYMTASGIVSTIANVHRFTLLSVLH
jgi:hypothetical protein